MATMDVPPPRVDVPDGWRVVSDDVTTPFDAVIVTVRAHTLVFADDRLRERVRDETGEDGTWRFFFASRLRITPETKPSRTLTKLVTKRANTGFVDVMRDKGFAEVRAVESRQFDVRGTDADLTRYRARITLRGHPIVVDGYFAVWPVGTSFLMAGGVYPNEVGSDELGSVLDSSLDAERFEETLFEMIRTTR
jgi:hypothetical protein